MMHYTTVLAVGQARLAELHRQAERDALARAARRARRTRRRQRSRRAIAVPAEASRNSQKETVR